MLISMKSLNKLKINRFKKIQKYKYIMNPIYIETHQSFHYFLFNKYQ